LGVQITKEIGCMTGITGTTQQATQTTAFSSRRTQAGLAAGVFLVLALLVAVQAGHSTQATTVPVQELVQQQQADQTLAGVTPKSEYGAGQLIVWDCGIYPPEVSGQPCFERADQPTAADPGTGASTQTACDLSAGGPGEVLVAMTMEELLNLQATLCPNVSGPPTGEQFAT